jgi:hypothetical protein
MLKEGGRTMRYKNKTMRIRVALRLVVGLTASLFVLSLTHVLNAEDFSSHERRFWNAESVSCGAELKHGYYKLADDLTCTEKRVITEPVKLNLNGHKLSGMEN